jgi:hypothetical protein
MTNFLKLFNLTHKEDSIKPNDLVLTEGHLDSGDYLIISKFNGQCLDSNANEAKQFSFKHPRCFLSDIYYSETQRWTLVNTKEKDENGQNLYLLIASNNQLALDGSINAPHFDQKHPAPFLFNYNLDVKSQKWVLLRPSSAIGNNTFYIMNYENGKFMDSNLSRAKHYDRQHKSPFLTKKGLRHFQQSKCWQFSPWPTMLIQEKSNNRKTILKNTFSHRALLKLSMSSPLPIFSPLKICERKVNDPAELSINEWSIIFSYLPVRKCFASVLLTCKIFSDIILNDQGFIAHIQERNAHSFVYRMRYNEIPPSGIVFEESFHELECSLLYYYHRIDKSGQWLKPLRNIGYLLGITTVARIQLPKEMKNNSDKLQKIKFCFTHIFQIWFGRQAEKFLSNSRGLHQADLQFKSFAFLNAIYNERDAERYLCEIYGPFFSEVIRGALIALDFPVDAVGVNSKELELSDEEFDSELPGQLRFYVKE